MASMFTATANLKKSIDIINGLDSAKFQLLLSRILQKFHVKDQKTFTDEEEEKLQAVLSLDSATKLKLIVETCEFIFHQAAYHSAKPAALAEDLEKLSLEGDKVSAIVDLWSSGGRDVIAKLRQQTIAPQQLESVNWRLHLQMSQATVAKMVQPKAVFELKTTSRGTGAQEHDKMVLEFGHEELYNFYNQLERIQMQIDALG